MRTVLLLVSIATIAFGQARVAVPMGPPPGSRSLWVLSADNKLSRYDVAQWRPLSSIPVSADVRKRPEDLIISNAGDVLFTKEEPYEEGLRHFSFIDFRVRTTLVGGAFERRPATGGGYLVTAAKPMIGFSRDGQLLYWFEYREQRLAREGDRWRTATFHAWTTDLTGEEPKSITEFTLPRCTCETGACSETCPEAFAWTPPAGVGDYFFVTRWVQGQTDTHYQETALYQRKNGAWTSRKLDKPVEQFLDAAGQGETFVAALRDSGCCGWSNEGDDTTCLVRNGVTTVRFDERQRFHNDNYDVSFYTSNALLSPDVTKLAYSIVASNQPGQELRLSDEGKENPVELERVKKALAEMPMAEVVGVSGSATLVSVPHAEVVGWLDNARILIVGGGEVKILDVASGKQTATGIKADAAKYVFLR